MTVLVIPAAQATPESPQMLDDLLWSIECQGINEAYKTIVCFDLVESVNFIHHITDKYPWVDSIINNGNRLNFAKNSNKGLRKAFHEYKDSAIVVNQDTLIPDRRYLDQICGEGIVSPQQITLVGTKEEKLVQLNEQNALQSEQRQQHNKLVGFFIYINYEVMKKIGFWDEYYITFEDDDLCIRSRLAGFPVETVGYRIHHEVSKCGQYDSNRLQLNFEKFKYKWALPPYVPHLECAEWCLKEHKWIPEMRCE